MVPHRDNAPRKGGNVTHIGSASTVAIDDGRPVCASVLKKTKTSLQRKTIVLMAMTRRAQRPYGIVL